MFHYTGEWKSLEQEPLSWRKNSDMNIQPGDLQALSLSVFLFAAGRCLGKRLLHTGDSIKLGCQLGQGSISGPSGDHQILLDVKHQKRRGAAQGVMGMNSNLKCAECA